MSYLDIVDQSIKLNRLVSKVANLPSVDPSEIHSFFEHVAADSKNSTGFDPRKDDAKRRTFTEDTDMFTERRRRSHLAVPSVHVVPSSSFFSSTAALGGNLNMLDSAR